MGFLVGREERRRVGVFIEVETWAKKIKEAGYAEGQVNLRLTHADLLDQA